MKIMPRLFLLLIGICMNMHVRNQVIAAPRIYYHEEKLQGDPIATKVINFETFDYILQHALRDVYTIEEVQRLVLIDGEFESVAIDMFKYCTVRKDGITYNAGTKSFYLPEAIILYDISDRSPFPSTFYFVAKIKDQLELCFCDNRENLKWDELPDSYTTTVDPVLIKKAEETINYLKDYVAYEVEQQTEEEAKIASVIANRKPLSKEKKAAYLNLTELCMPDSHRKGQVRSLIEELKDYNDGEGYGTTYDEFRMFLNNKQIPFIITVDWKESIEELEAWVSDAVKENFEKTFRFDTGGKYNEESTVSDEGLIASFDQQLQKIGLQISMIETGGDEYQLIIHAVDAADEVLQAMKIIEIQHAKPI